MGEDEEGTVSKSKEPERESALIALSGRTRLEGCSCAGDCEGMEIERAGWLESEPCCCCCCCCCIDGDTSSAVAGGRSKGRTMRLRLGTEAEVMVGEWSWFCFSAEVIRTVL